MKTILSGGKLLDKKNNYLFSELDILVQNGKIRKIGKNIEDSEAIVIDLKGKIISGKYQDSFITFNGTFENGRLFNGEGKRLVKDTYNNVDYWADLAWEQEQEERQEEEPSIDSDYEIWMMKNDPNYTLVEKEYAKIKIKNGKEELDENTIEKRLVFERIR